MSRCYLFPPPGYEKKTNQPDLGLSKKKEKHKHKKKKRRRDSEPPNGDVHDKHGGQQPQLQLQPQPQPQPQPQQQQQRQQQRQHQQQESLGSAGDNKPALYSKVEDVNGNAEGAHVDLSRTSGANSSLVNDDGDKVSTRHNHEIEKVVIRQKQKDLPSLERESWSVVDDQEWLITRNASLSSKADVKAEEDGRNPQVWAEALHLPSVDMYALPYVVPF